MVKLRLFILLVNVYVCITDETQTEDGWSQWSNWSECSRSCGRGLAIQTRRCQHWQGCRGNTVRYNVCELDDCPSSVPDFYQEQCSAHDSEGRRWVSANPGGSCSLLCKIEGTTEVVQLNSKVKDGTLCTGESEGMCVQGVCQRIGCDLILGSDKKVDACGVCGGDGSSCGNNRSRWRRRLETPCSASCGGGYQVLSAVCEDINTRQEVPSSLCVTLPRPSPVITNCGNKPCPASWQMGPWTECSVECGIGYQTREIFCAESKNNTITRRAIHSCLEPRPIHWKSCVNMCPKWVKGVWQQCSVTCGDGVRKRTLECRHDDGSLSNECDFMKRPNGTQPCSTGIPCEPTEPTLPEHFKSWSEGSNDFFISGQHLHLQKQPVPAEPTFIASEWGKCSAPCGEGLRTRNVTCKIFLEFSRTIPVLPDEQCPGERPVTTKKCFIKPCSDSEKSLHLSSQRDLPVDSSSYAFSSMESTKDFSPNSHSSQHEYLMHEKKIHSDSMVKEDIPSPSKLKSSMEDTVGDDVNTLFSSPNSEELFHQNSVFFHDGFLHNNAIEPESYHWKHGGYTSCSESCLGGVQESIYHCVQNSNEKRVEATLCNLKERPDSITRTCNYFPCPPQWEVGEFEPCSKSCGGGLTSREVKCIQKITRSMNGKMVAPNDQCPQPPPYSQKYCNMEPCPPRWVAGKWSKCSASCGGGYRMRTIRCVEQLPLNKEEETSEEKCPKAKPVLKRRCGRRSCDKSLKKFKRGPIIKTNPKQIYKQTRYRKLVQLKIGGIAYILPGSKVKIRCPVRRYDRRKLVWLKDGKKLTGKIGRLRISKKRILRIKKIELSDQGVYTCKAGTQRANITLRIKENPATFGSMEDTDNISDNDVYSNRFDVLGKKLAKPSVEVRRDGKIEANTPNDLQKNDDKSSKNILKSIIYGKMNHHKEQPKSHRGVSLLSVALANGGLHEDIPNTTQKRTHVFGTVQETSENGKIPTDNIYFGKMNHDAPRSQPDDYPIVLRDHKERSAESAHEILDFGHASFAEAFSGNGSSDDFHILGKGDRDSLEFEWKVTNWTACSQTCSFSSNNAGFQFRSLQCIVKVQNISRIVENSLCIDAGLAGPPTLQKCGFDECPRWQVDDWTDCENSRCFTLHHALQKREISCILHDGTKANLDQCDEITKPSNNRECYNRKCVGVWHTGEWSKCTAPCGGQGYRTRVLQCVWNGTKKSAGNACRELARPEVVRWCDGQPCVENTDIRPSSSTDIQCEDQSKYCRIVVRIHMCKVKHYREQCCRSCQ